LKKIRKGNKTLNSNPSGPIQITFEYKKRITILHQIEPHEKRKKEKAEILESMSKTNNL
jgi:hypothetical protein